MQLSIITVNLNNKEGLFFTLDSLFNKQTFIDYESIVIDGGSDDGSLEVLKSYDYRIGYWVSEKDSGIYNAMNKGLSRAKGEYVLFLNSGDCLINDVLSKVFSQKLESDFVYGNCIQCYPGGERKEVKVSPYLTFFDFYMGSLIHSATFIRRSLFNDYLYSEKYRIVSDWEFFLRKIVLENSTTQYMDLFISEFDMTGISSNEKYRKIQKEERMEVLNTYLPLRILQDYSDLATLKDIEKDPIFDFILRTNATLTFKRFMIKILSLIYKVYAFIRL